jgi:hypothetical protein
MRIRLLAFLLGLLTAACAADFQYYHIVPGLKLAQAPAAGIPVTSTPAPAPTVPAVFEVETLAGAPLNTVTFDSTPVGLAATALTVALKQTAGSLVALSAQQLAVAAPFSITGTTCAGTLSVGQSCNITLGFLPTTAGDFTVPLSVTAGDQTTTPANVYGYGTNSAIQVTGVTGPANPVVGSTYTYGIAVRNTSSVAVSLSATGAQNPGAVAYEPYGISVPAKGTATVNVKVTPGQAGYFEPVMVLGTYAKAALRFTATSTYANSAMEAFDSDSPLPSAITRLNYTAGPYIGRVLSNRATASPLAATVVTVPANASAPTLQVRATGRDGSTLTIREGSLTGTAVANYSFGTWTGIVQVFSVNLTPGKTYYVIPKDSGSYSTSVYSVLALWN